MGAPLMAIAIMISTFGCANGLILMGARLTYAMARDRLFFSAVGHLNRHGVPAAGLWFQAIWASLLTFSGTYNDLLDYVIFAALLFYVLTAIGLFVLRFRRPDAERPYRAWGYPVAPCHVCPALPGCHGRSVGREAGLHLARINPGSTRRACVSFLEIIPNQANQ